MITWYTITQGEYTEYNGLVGEGEDQFRRFSILTQPGKKARLYQYETVRDEDGFVIDQKKLTIGDYQTVASAKRKALTILKGNEK